MSLTSTSPVDSSPTADRLHQCYAAMLGDLSLAPGQSRPYNLLMTRRWIMLVPRTREHFEGVSLNSLAFAGVFFVHHRDHYEQLVKAGPCAALRWVTGQ